MNVLKKLMCCGNKSKIRDQVMRNSFKGPGFPKTPQKAKPVVNPASRQRRRN